MPSPEILGLPRFLVVLLAFFSSLLMTPNLISATEDPFAAAVESARKARDEKQLTSLQEQLEQRVAQNGADAILFLDLAKVNSYLLDVAEMRNDKKVAGAAVDKAIEAVLRSIQLNDKSADAHSLLADLYGRKISLGNGMFAGPKFGPKVKEENAKAIALDDKNPRVWASLGRQYLMAPKMFGGDVTKPSRVFKSPWPWMLRKMKPGYGFPKPSKSRATRPKPGMPSGMPSHSIQTLPGSRVSQTHSTRSNRAKRPHLICRNPRTTH